MNLKKRDFFFLKNKVRGIYFPKYTPPGGGEIKKLGLGKKNEKKKGKKKREKGKKEKKEKRKKEKKGEKEKK